MTATNRNLTDAVRAGTFREDLYYRLKVVELRVPPLRERAEDILPLAHILLADAAGRMGRPAKQFGADVDDLLLSYPWPGNVRELSNATERIAALGCGELVEAEDLAGEIRFSVDRATATVDTVRPLADVERDYILAALGHNHGNQTLTARQLRIGTATLYRKLRSYRALA